MEREGAYRAKANRSTIITFTRSCHPANQCQSEHFALHRVQAATDHLRLTLLADFAMVTILTGLLGVCLQKEQRPQPISKHLLAESLLASSYIDSAQAQESPPF